MYLFMAGLGLHCFLQSFSSCSERGLLSNCGMWASHYSGFSCCREWALGRLWSIIVAHGISCPVACGIFPDQGLNLCTLHWQVDSQPLDHQRSPYMCVYIYPFITLCPKISYLASVWPYPNHFEREKKTFSTFLYAKLYNSYNSMFQH